MTARGFCWWAYRYHRPLFDALAYGGRRLNAVTTLVWLVRIEEESTGAPITAEMNRDQVTAQMLRTVDEEPTWAPLLLCALAPTAVSAYRWLDKRAMRTYDTGGSAGVLQLVRPTFGGSGK